MPDPNRRECYSTLRPLKLNRHARRAVNHAAYQTRLRTPMACKGCQHIGKRLRRTRDQQAARCLRIAQQGLVRRRYVRSKLDFSAVGSPVAS